MITYYQVLQASGVKEGAPEVRVELLREAISAWESAQDAAAADDARLQLLEVDARDVSAYDGHVARVVVRALVLLVGLIVLLIHDDEAEIGIGQHQRRTRANHHMRFTRCDRGPVARARARRQLRMPFQRTHTKALCNFCRKRLRTCT